jgi:AhpD family alkylhydroperoxidase
MTARINNPASLLPESMTGIQAIIKAAHRSGVPRSTMDLAHLRASQINGCSPCVYSGAISAKKSGESDERLFAVAAWRETDLFTDQERAGLALAESMTRLADRADPVPDDVWAEAEKHFDEKQLAGLVLWVATTNLFNRINVATKQPAGVAW